jgi:transcriptional regulator with XRE-family HTH domain
MDPSVFGIPNECVGQVNTVGPSVDAYHREMATRIRQLLRKRKISQNVLADLAGVARGQLSAIINAEQSPTVRTLKKIADAFGVNPRELLPTNDSGRAAP